MSDLARAADSRQIWLTRSHLVALGVSTVFIAALAFTVGLQVGRSQTEPAPQAEVERFLPGAEDQDALEALLREVEAAQVAAPANAEELSFPTALPSGEGAGLALPDAEPTPASAHVGAPAGDPIAGPADVPGDVPTSGWSVQVAAYETAGEADARIQALIDAGHDQAYRVVARIDGVDWHRVRIGGFRTQAAADEARLALETELGTADLMVAAAP